jgi:hypothetical protein
MQAGCRCEIFKRNGIRPRGKHIQQEHGSLENLDGDMRVGQRCAAVGSAA